MISNAVTMRAPCRNFNVLRAEVSLANERPALIQAQNNYRIAKNNLCNLLGYNLPRDIWEDIPLNLTDTLDAAPTRWICPTPSSRRWADARNSSPCAKPRSCSD